MARRVLLCGATSAIAQETARLLSADGDRLFLVARDAGRLDIVASDLRARGARKVETLIADLDDTDRHEAIIDEAFRALDGLDTLFVAHGILGNQDVDAADPAAAERVFRTNFLSAASLVTRVARRFEDQGGGTIVAISSVAGDRGRQSNYVYGASKGALTLFLQGLRNRLQGTGVRVLTVKPGMVDTPMTEHMDKGLLFARPDAIAGGIHRAMRRRADVVYLPWFWSWIMRVIRWIPEPLFKRMRI